MNKSWKSFDMLTSSPVCTTKQAKGKSSSNRVIGSSRKTTSHIKRFNSRKALFNAKQVLERITSSDEEFKIDDPSDDESEGNDERKSLTRNHPLNASRSRDVLNSESDIDDVSENDAFDRNEKLPESDSGGSDCESIHCKRMKITTLNFINTRSPGSARRITDDLFIVTTATESEVDKDTSSNSVKPVSVTNDTHETLRIVPVGTRNNWSILSDTFNISNLRNVCKNTPSRTWKSFNESFGPSSKVEIECADTQTSTILPNTEKNTIIENVPDSEGEVSHTDSSKNCRLSYLQQPARLKCTKNSPLNYLRIALHEKISRQSFWLHERQMRLVTGKRPVKIDCIHNVFNRVSISYLDNEDPELQHILYLDPAEQVLRLLVVGSLIEVEYDIEPHKVSHRKLIHLGVGKIKAID